MRPISEMPERWAIYIDLEGFSQIYDQDGKRALRLLGRLIEDLWLIGSRIYPEPPDRLFIHQLGDGFVVVSDFMEDSLERPVAISVTLMRSILLYGGVARTGISSGEFADVKGCYSDAVVENFIEHGGLNIGSGIMSIFPVMGSALINANRVANKTPKKGPCLFIDRKLEVRLEDLDVSVCGRTENAIELDWISSGIPLADNLLTGICRAVSTPAELGTKLNEYIDRFEETLAVEWIDSARKLIPHK